MSPPRVTVLGRCHVYGPFRMLEDAGKVELRNRGVYSYVHYARVSLQQLRAMHGEIKIPLALKTLITHKVVPANADETLQAWWKQLYAGGFATEAERERYLRPDLSETAREVGEATGALVDDGGTGEGTVGATAT